MKRQIILLTMLLFWGVFGAFAQEAVTIPVAISPGSETKITTVSQRCPTFSWSSVDQAASYRIAIFQSTDGNLLSYEDMVSMLSPVISKHIAGKASSWTLSAEESLHAGNIYIWYVQAADSYGNPMGYWSNGIVFKVEQEVVFSGIEWKLGEILKSQGVSDQTIKNTLKDLKREMNVGMAQGVEGKKTQGQSGIQGFEGSTNTFYGLNAGFSVTSGVDNIFLGYNSGYFNTTGSSNSFFGSWSGYQNTTGFSNSFIGTGAGGSNTTGANNSFFGYGAGACNTNGFANSFFGSVVGATNTTGYSNSFFGFAAGQFNTTGHDNSFIGFYAGNNNTTGYSNTLVGHYAGYTNSTGFGNNFLGNKAGYFETGSNKLYIANSDTTSPLVYGEFDNNILTVNGKLGINTTTPSYTIEANAIGSNACVVVKRTDGATNYINATATYANFGSTTNHPLRLVVNSVARMTLNTDGSLNMSNGATCTSGGVWTNASSRTLKENIQVLDTAKAMVTLAGLKPVTYNYKTDKTDQYVGFIAEDVPELVATADRKGLSPMDVTAVLTKVVQEQQNMIQDLQKKNQEYKKVLSLIMQRMDQLEKKK